MNTRVSRIERDAMYHYEPNPDHAVLPADVRRHSPAPARQLLLFAHREQAAASGLDPCIDCRPDLHPLPR